MALQAPLEGKSSTSDSPGERSADGSLGSFWLGCYLAMGLFTLLLPAFHFSDQQILAGKQNNPSYVAVGCALLTIWTLFGVFVLRSGIKSLRGASDSLPKGPILVLGVLAIVAAWSRPMWSVDTTYYIAYGRQLTEYGLNPYEATLNASINDSVISQVEKFWFFNTCFYGPLALSLYAVANMVVGTASLYTLTTTLKFLWIPFYLWLGWVLHARWKSRPACWLLLFCALGNPLMLGLCLVDGHVDLLIALFLLLTAHWLDRERPVYSALTLAASASLKIVGIVCLPICFVWFLRRSWRMAGKFLGSFLVVYGGTYLAIGGGEFLAVVRFAKKWSTLDTASVIPGLLAVCGVSDIPTAVMLSNIFFYGTVGLTALAVLTKKLPGSAALPMGIVMTALLFTRTYFQLWYNLWFWPLLWYAARTDKQAYLMIGTWTAVSTSSFLFDWSGRRWLLAIGGLICLLSFIHETKNHPASPEDGC